ATGPERSRRAPSWRRSRRGLPNAGRISVSRRRSMARPPLPWASWMVSVAGTGTGQASAKPLSFIALLGRLRRRHAAIPVVGGACTFGRNHGDTEGMLGRTARAKGRTFGRLAFAAEDQAADALALFLLLRHHCPEPGLGVEVVVGLSQGEAA